MSQRYEDMFPNYNYVFVYLDGRVEGSDDTAEARGIWTSWQERGRVFLETNEFDDGEDMDTGDGV